MKKISTNVDVDINSFLTTGPNALAVTINHERMPALVSNEGDFETWLSATALWPSILCEVTTQRYADRAKRI